VVPQSDVLKTDTGRELLDIEEGQERRHRNDVPMYWGEEGDMPGEIVHPAGTEGLTLQSTAELAHLEVRNYDIRVGRELVVKSESIHWDDKPAHFGSNEDFDIVYDSGTDRLEIVDAVNGVNLLQFIKNEGMVHALALDSAPAHEVGKMVLASPTWDPDGDGNGELVMSDGSAWQEVVDLPNYT